MTERSVNIKIMSPRTKEQLEALKEGKRKLILEAALELFALQGFNNASISQLAKKAGISKGLIYTYFESKDEILRAMMKEVKETAMARFEMPPEGKMNKEAMIRLIDLSIDLVLEDTDHYKLYFSIFTQPHVFNMLMGEMWEQAAPLLKMFADYYREKGVEDPMAMMRYFSATIDGIQMHLMIDPENFPVEEVKKMVKEQFV